MAPYTGGNHMSRLGYTREQQAQKAAAWDALIARLEELETYAGNRSQYERTRRLVNEAQEETLPVRYEI